MGVFSLLICFSKSIDQISFLSYIGGISFIVTSILIFVLLGQSFHFSSEIQQSAFHISSVRDFIYSIVKCSSIICNTQMVEHVVQVMERPQYRRFSLTYVFSASISPIFAIIVSFLGSFIFDENLDGNIVLKFDSSQNDKNLIIAAQITMLIFLIVSYLFRLYVNSRHFFQVFSGPIEIHNWLNNYSLPTFFSGLTMIALISWLHVAKIKSEKLLLICQIGVILYCFILPPVYFLKMFPFHEMKLWSIFSILFLILGVFIIIVTIYFLL
ncbi:hypothetical protein TRFO_35662 [Tritrichomonas foetus]|uniref:Amino acid transporter transmembrane domain-containing protein n=1 Tax=Tritrichomonas foetus TaxID=1144522 RepID=A0A1J4JKE7_9EUKA|nr:hypothetical protein TRFO_35662 [Tritrichomonas foetus]|eukprot:OHS98019.1 hypothetical protein TRFO_35662 [Tritrichomonas foetus]